MPEPELDPEPPQRPENANTACSACGAPLRCGALAGEPTCWCAALPAVAPEPGADCLCAPCLRERVRRREAG